MTTISHKTDVKVHDGEIVLRRIFNAPRDLVFQVWTEPQYIVKWWGPSNLNSTCKIDLRVGGLFQIVMHSSDGIDYPIEGEYLEIVIPERIVSTVSLDGHPPEWFAMLNSLRPSANGKPFKRLVWTILFDEINSKTEVTIRTHFITDEDRDAFLKMGMAEGWSQSFERFDEVIATVLGLDK